jgi:hypothetical protein
VRWLRMRLTVFRLLLVIAIASIMIHLATNQRPGRVLQPRRAPAPSS